MEAQRLRLTVAIRENHQASKRKRNLTDQTIDKRLKKITTPPTKMLGVIQKA